MKNQVTIWSSNPFPRDISGKDKKIQKDTCTPVFIAALFKVAKIWKQPKCPSIAEWIKKRLYIYTYIHTVEYYVAIKKEWNNTTCTNMDGPRNYDTKWGKSDKDKYHMMSLICGIWKKWYKWIYLWNRNSQT